MLSEEQRVLVEDNMRLVPHVLIHKLHVSPGDPLFEDLMQDGYLVLCQCALRFDTSLGYKFDTYAGRTAELVLRSRRRDYNSAGYSRKYSDLYTKIMKYLVSRPEATAEEICCSLGCSTIDYTIAIHYYDAVSLDEIVPMKGDSTSQVSIMDTIADPNSGYAPTLEELDEISCEVIGRLRYMNNLHRDIFTEWIYSMIYDEKLSQEDLSLKYNIAQASVSRILKRYTKQFKEELENYILE